MSPADAAQVLGVSRPMVYRYLEQGLLEDHPVNTSHRIPAGSVYRLAEQRRDAARRAARLLDAGRIATRGLEIASFAS